MSKEALYDMIERYLDGNLTDAQRSEVETRLAADPDFRAEVELHRQLRDELGDPELFKMRKAVENLMQNPPALPQQDDFSKTDLPKKGNQNWRRFGILGIALLIIGASVWFFNKKETVTPPPKPDEINKPTNDPLPPTPSNSTPPEKDNPPTTKQKTSPIASTSSKKYALNPDLETRINDQQGGTRGDEVKIMLSNPTLGQVVKSETGGSSILFKGSVESNLNLTDQPLSLMVYSNSVEEWEKRQPRFTLPFLMIPGKEPGDFSVNFIQKIALAPGVHYLVIGQTRGDSVGGGFRLYWFGRVEVR